jgi:hypothetical protein
MVQWNPPGNPPFCQFSAAKEELVMSRARHLCAVAVIIAGVLPASGSRSTHTIEITSVSPGAERVVSIGSWYELSDSDGWTFRPDTDVYHLELALYDSATALAAGTTPFEQHRTRTSALWPDGPENELGELGYEVSPNVLGDHNQHLYGKPHYRSIRLYAGHLSPDNVYQVSFPDSTPSRIWLHPLRSNYFTMSANILQSSESTLTSPVYGPASVSRTIIDADSTRFAYSGLSPDSATGLKDDYPVGSYGQRPGSHGNGDFGWFPGYSQWVLNEGPGSVVVALFVTTGFTGPSGAPSNTLANDTFWKSDEIFLSMGDTATVKWHFDDVQGYSLSDNPFPHTAGGQSAPDGTAGAAVNVFDRLQVSAIGWEVRSGGDRADASLILTPRAATVDQQTNVICVPDQEYLTSAVPTKSVDIEYLGGGSGLVYGYSVVFSWDGAIASTAPGSVTEGTLLSSAGSTSFSSSVTGTNEITVDCELLGEEPGVAGPGTMFSIEFTGLSFGTSPIDVTVDQVHDKDLNTLTGFAEEDGELVVDVQAPAVTGTYIENVTLAHTDDYTKHGDAAQVTATVTDDDPAFGASNVVADLSGLGGSAAVSPDDYTRGVATWNLASVVCTPANGTVAVTVTATDPIGNVTSEGDDIIADNTAPGTVEGLAATPAHQEVGLSWDDPTGLDANYRGVVVRYAAWDDYPYYITSAPEYPADELAGDGEAFNGLGAVTGATHSIENRGIYYYSAFACDQALNYGGVDSGGQDRSTNYWLGDVSDELGSWGYDGLVNDADIDKLGGNYALAPPVGVPGYAECDVGPTDDHSRFGVPEPDDIIEFEDLVIFAMNYEAVSPRVVPFLPLPETRQQLALSVEERSVSGSGEVELSLVLSGNVGEVKALSSTLTYDVAELVFVSARMSAEVSSSPGEVFFWHGCEDGSVRVDLAVLGTDVTVGGSGEVAVLTFAALSDEHGVEIESAHLRGAENQPLDADLEDFESVPERPQTFHLAQNVPNPFNPVTKIAYHVPHESEVTIRVYDATGRIVTTLVDAVVQPGRHEATWNGQNDRGEAAGSGVYFCAMEAPDFRERRKLTLLK